MPEQKSQNPIPSEFLKNLTKAETKVVTKIEDKPEERLVDHSEEMTEEELIEHEFLILEQILKSTKWDWVTVSHPTKREQYQNHMKGLNKQYKKCEKISYERARNLWNKYVRSPYSER